MSHIKRLALLIPPVRWLREGRFSEAGLRRFVGTFSFTRPGTPDWQTIPLEQTPALAQELGWRALVRGRLDAIMASQTDAWFKVKLNGVTVVLPRYTLMTMRHCIGASPDHVMELLVETSHSDRMKAEFVDGALFLDVGAATGAMTLPYALSLDKKVRLVAFEPSLRARDYLVATLKRNGAEGVTVLPFALSDNEGSVEFMELPEDEVGDTPFLPEGSRLRTSDEQLFAGAKPLTVAVTTLDNLADQLDYASATKIVIKIDVEGFEDKVLLGASDMLRRYKPFLSIDIHEHPGTTKLTDEACQDILLPLGYRIERMGHVMLARAG